MGFAALNPSYGNGGRPSARVAAVAGFLGAARGLGVLLGRHLHRLGQD